MRFYWILATLAVLLVSGLRADAGSQPVEQTNQEALNLAGKNGFGLATVSIPAFSAGAAATALTYRRWLSDRFALDVFAAVGADDSFATVGSTHHDTSTYMFGFGMKMNLARPVEYLRIQAFLDLMGARNFDSDGTTQVTSYGEAVALGLGFEAFLPFWPALSVEGGIGLNYSGNESFAQPSGVYTNSHMLGSFGQSLSPLNAAVHYYF